MTKNTNTMGPEIFSVTAEFKCTKYLAVSQEFRYNFLTAIVHYARMLDYLPSGNIIHFRFQLWFSNTVN